MLTNIGGILLASGVLVWASRMSVDAFEKLTLKLRLSKLAVAAVLVALSTSLPELSVAIVASIEGVGAVSVGNVLGSNVANLSLVVAGAVILGGSVAVVGDYLRREFVAMILVGVSPLILMLDGVLDRLDGVVLVALYLLYVKGVVMAGKHVSLAEKGVEHKGILARLETIHRNHVDKMAGRLFLGLGLMLLAAEAVVRFATALSGQLALPLLLVGIVIVAMGTVLPEFVLSIRAVQKKQAALMFGNILGSCAVNSSLILGVAVLIAPLSFSGFRSLSRFWLAGGVFVFMFILFWWFTVTKKRLDRWEGLVLLGLYLLFVSAQILLD